MVRPLKEKNMRQAIKDRTSPLGRRVEAAKKKLQAEAETERWSEQMKKVADNAARREREAANARHAVDAKAEREALAAEAAARVRKRTIQKIILTAATGVGCVVLLYQLVVRLLP